MTEIRILVVEDERITALDLRATLESLGYEVPAMATSADDAVAQAAEHQPDLVLMDIVLDGKGDGVDASRRIRDQQDVPILYLTAYSDSATLDRAKITEPFGYIVKPFKERELHAAIEVGLYKHRMDRRLKHLNEVLRAIRNVNQLIVQEKDRDRLVQRACDCLTETRGYNSAWITLGQTGDSQPGGGSSGLTPEQQAYLATADTAASCPCLEAARTSGSPAVMESSVSRCNGCRVVNNGERRTCLASALNSSGMTFGYLVVNTDSEAGHDPEEQDLFAEVAGDLAFALHSMHTDALRVLAESEVSEARDSAQRSEADLSRVQSQLLHSQKMEAIGRLAGGVAHDFNNILTAVRGFAEFIVADLEPEAQSAADAREIIQSAESGARLNAQLLAFARKQIISPQVVDLNEVVTRSLNMLERLIGEDVDVDFVATEGLWATEADPGQMDQILINLAVNAQDAMPGGGKLTIETANATHDQTYVDGHPDVQTGEYVMLAVSDDGHGMDAEALSHMFEPFYTTKSMGKGTGLGLAMVYGIVQQQGGFVYAYSEVGHGTTLKIYLPRVQREVAPRVRPATSKIFTGIETVLVVEDAEAVRNLTVRILRRAGYHVLEAENGAEGFLRAKQHEGPIHLLLTDVVMPLMNGKELYDELVALHPDLPVLYMSGYTDNAIAHRGVLDTGTSFLPKPFSGEQLLEKVREVIDNR